MLSEEKYRARYPDTTRSGLWHENVQFPAERRGRFFVATALVFRLSIGSTSSPDRKHPATPVTMRLLLS